MSARCWARICFHCPGCDHEWADQDDFDHARSMGNRPLCLPVRQLAGRRAALFTADPGGFPTRARPMSDDLVWLTCASCFASQLVPANTVGDGVGIGVWWTELRMHSCATCFAHTCWEPIGVGVTQSVCFLDAGHPGRHLPWRESYGDVVEGAVPLIDLSSAS